MLEKIAIVLRERIQLFALDSMSHELVVS